MVFDTAAFLATNFRTPAGLSAFLTAYAAPNPGDEVVRKWFQRRSVPSEWLPLLLLYLELDTGTPVSLAPYFSEKVK